MKRLLLLPLLLTACLDDVLLPPDPPTLDLIGDVVRVPVLKGGKPAGTSVLVGSDPTSADDATEIVAVDDADTWRASVALLPGDNDLVLWTRSKEGLDSYEPLVATVVFEPNFPDAPTLDQPTPIVTNALPVHLSGSKPPGASVVLDDVEVAALGNDVVWEFDVADLDEGSYVFALVAVDARGKRSEPVDVAVVYDVTAPTVASRFPAAGDAPSATNGVISLVFDEDLALDAAALPETLVDVNNGLADVVGIGVAWVAESRALRVAPPAAGWPANATLTMRLDPAGLGDLAGNVPARAADFVFQVATGAADDVSVPGDVVVVDPVPLPDADGDGALELFATPTTAKTLTLSGTKTAPSSITVNGIERVPLSSSTTWTLTVALPRGETVLRLGAVSAAGATGAELSVEVTRVVQPPAAPVVDAHPERVEDAEIELTGTRDANTTLVLDGVPVVPRGPETDWSFVLPLNPGTNSRLLVARLVDDGEVLESPPVLINVELAQQYDGEIGDDASIGVSFRFKDLSRSDPVRAEFNTGPNNFAADIWIEGPLEPGEECRFEDGERTGIKYADTIIHYQGTKSGHISPWFDEDYRSPDYLAALVAGGRLPAFSASADRRADDGSPNDGFGNPVNIPESEVSGLDGVTQATLKNGSTHSFTWRAADSTRPRLAQGEYLVHVALHLDRAGAWLSDNDVESCWLDPAFSAEGMHRVTARLSLGDIAYDVELGEAAEVSGPDVDAAAGVLRYLDGPITFSWRP